ncbi:MAG: 3-isopropylmalate dehydratase large subunit [Woeseiaceae bacterium]
MPATLFDKIWDTHRVSQLDDGSELIYVDRVFLHERTGAVALQSLAEADRPVRNPRHVFASMDHIVDTLPGRGDKTQVPGGEAFIQSMRSSAADAGIRLFDIGDIDHGITHLVSAEQAITLPGLVVACPDSHTCTLGALGAIGWGVGSSDCEHALATETLRSTKPKQMRVNFNGPLGTGVTAKDMILHLIGQYSASGGAGHAIEFSGDTIDALSLEARFTLCNMAVEFSAFTGVVAPDDKVFDFLSGKNYAPSGDEWTSCIAEWRALATDEDAGFDKELHVDSTAIAPTVTWGISPQHAIPVTGNVPAIDAAADDDERHQMKQALKYMGLDPGRPLIGLPIDGAFIGSCTNARLSDLRSAAAILIGAQVADGIRAICTPGSMQVKKAAEEEGIDEIFRAAGFEWREPGCSLCFNAGGESFDPQDRVMTSTNRNFRGRQGPGTRSHLASPASVAAAAVAGHIVDVREAHSHG